MAVHCGRLRQAARAATTDARAPRRCTGTVGNSFAKYSRSMTMRRGLDNRIARPRMDDPPASALDGYNSQGRNYARGWAVDNSLQGAMQARPTATPAGVSARQ